MHSTLHILCEQHFINQQPAIDWVLSPSNSAAPYEPWQALLVVPILCTTVNYYWFNISYPYRCLTNSRGRSATGISIEGTALRTDVERNSTRILISFANFRMEQVSFLFLKISMDHSSQSEATSLINHNDPSPKFPEELLSLLGKFNNLLTVQVTLHLDGCNLQYHWTLSIINRRRRRRKKKIRTICIWKLLGLPLIVFNCLRPVFIKDLVVLAFPLLNSNCTASEYTSEFKLCRPVIVSRKLLGSTTNRPVNNMEILPPTLHSNFQWQGLMRNVLPL